MQVSDFDFPFDASLIAQYPIEPRDVARLLDMSGTEPVHRYIRDLPRLIRSNDLLVVNNTKVLPARLFGYRDSVPVEATLVRQLADDTWIALARPGRRLKRGHQLTFSKGLIADLIDKDGVEITLKFRTSGSALLTAIRAQGVMPLPPYIKRPRGGDRADYALYQTPFAKYEGAVAAPTASLHFTDAVRASLPCPVAEITLHVGLGTFASVGVADTNDHVMHVEWGELKLATATAIAACRARAGRVIAIGTTVARVLEAFGGKAQAGNINLFITPGYTFRIVDAMLTNFHLPKSTLFMMVSAFAGLSTLKRAYTLAQAKRYRFFSYGDACWLERR